MAWRRKNQQHLAWRVACRCQGVALARWRKISAAAAPAVAAAAGIARRMAQHKRQRGAMALAAPRATLARCGSGAGMAGVVAASGGEKAAAAKSRSEEQRHA